jgi:hypothetical protein
MLNQSSCTVGHHARPSPLYCWCVLVVCLVAQPHFVFAQSRPSKIPPTAREKIIPNGEAKPGLLILVNGNIVEGKISESPSGFLVQVRSNKYLVPYGRVRFEAANRREAYLKQRKFLIKPAPREHVTLARWCFEQKLFAEARIELRDALRLSPRNPFAREMLVQMEEILNPDDPVNKQRDPSTRRDDAGFELSETKSLAGLSRDVVQEYVSRVQPLLMNRCGNASCHGSTKGTSDFSLERVRVGFRRHRGPNERNLKQVIEQIDTASPDRSPLLTVTTGRHGGSRRDVFVGSAASKQRETLRNWIRKVTKELDQQSTTVVAAKSKTKTAKRIGKSKAIPSDDPFFRKILRDERPDAFDPREFNRGNRKSASAPTRRSRK